MLEKNDGIKHETYSNPHTHFRLQLNDILILNLLDRLDGVYILAESLCQEHSTGKYHEFVRLFELAFKKTFTNLTDELFEFLQGSNKGYTKNEISDWINLRHPSTHADFKITQNIIFESDIARFIPRMEQAAYDVLLNKECWLNPKHDRREFWNPSNSITSDCRIKITGSDGGGASFTIYDKYYVFPEDLNSVNFVLPSILWSKWDFK